MAHGVYTEIKHILQKTYEHKTMLTEMLAAVHETAKIAAHPHSQA